MDYSVIIPTHNEGEELLATVNSVVNSLRCCYRHRTAVEIIVFDDRCDDGSVQELERTKLSVPLTIIQDTGGWGLVYAKRMGAEKATGDMLVFLDSHSRAGERWLHHLEAGMQAAGGPDAGLYGPTMHSLHKWDAYEQGKTWPKSDMQGAFLPAVPFDSPPREAMYVCGNNQAISLQLYNAVGGFDPHLRPPWGVEDEEICLRLWRYGYKCQIIPSWHMSSLYRDDKGFPYPIKGDHVAYNRLRMAALHLDARRYQLVLGHTMLWYEKSIPPIEGGPQAARYNGMLKAVSELQTDRTPTDRGDIDDQAALTINDVFDLHGLEW